MIDYSNQGVVWYAMKTTYKRELKAKAYLDAHAVENFIPMCQKVVMVRGKKQIIEVPALHNLIFVKTDIVQLAELKSHLTYLHNQLVNNHNILTPVIVPTEQMNQFINAVTHHLEKIIYTDLTEVSLAKGTPVRITEGDFKGYEGVLERIKGKRDRRVHVSIEGIVAYRFDVEACFVEKIK